MTDSIVGEIIWVDSFGNLITNIDESILPDVEAGKLGVAIGRHHIAGINRCYAERPAGELLAVIGSSGQLEIAVNQGNAARELDVSMAAQVQVTATNHIG